MSGRAERVRRLRAASRPAPRRRSTASSTAVIAAIVPATSPARATSSSVPLTSVAHHDAAAAGADARRRPSGRRSSSSASRSRPPPNDWPTRSTAPAAAPLARSSSRRLELARHRVELLAELRRTRRCPPSAPRPRSRPRRSAAPRRASWAIWRPSERATVSAKASAQTRNADQDEDDPERVLGDRVLELAVGIEDVDAERAAAVEVRRSRSPSTRYSAPSISTSPSSGRSPRRRPPRLPASELAVLRQRRRRARSRVRPGSRTPRRVVDRERPARPAACRSASTTRLRAGAIASPLAGLDRLLTVEREPHARGARPRGEVARAAAAGRRGRRRGPPRRAGRPADRLARPPSARVARVVVERPPPRAAPGSRESSFLPFSESRTIRMPTAATASTGRMTSTMKKKVSRLRKLTCIPGRPAYARHRGRPPPATIRWPSRGEVLLRYAGFRGYSSVGRAPGSHPGGRGFESP